jgi:hypothetical protein
VVALVVMIVPNAAVSPVRSKGQTVRRSHRFRVHTAALSRNILWAADRLFRQMAIVGQSPPAPSLFGRASRTRPPPEREGE